MTDHDGSEPITVGNAREKPMQPPVTAAPNCDLITAATIGGRIRAVRHQAGLTQQEFARALGFSKRALVSWEGGRVEPSVTVLPALRRTYGVDLDWLVMGDGTLPDPIGLRRSRAATNVTEPPSSQLWLFEEITHSASAKDVPPPLPTVLGGIVEHVAPLA
ncbi:helix-turn-helix domain-containing protein [Pseudomonas sp.]|uniref:helix-turn-helix domain-containing protein n=1 Tax=Pseudomonas sp. TaxID=306 RepID=UPI003D0EA43F